MERLHNGKIPKWKDSKMEKFQDGNFTKSKNPEWKSPDGQFQT